MSSFDRRIFLLSSLALGACGFTPAYGPGGGAQRLQNAIALTDPVGRDGYLLNQRLEERLGRGGDTARYRMNVTPQVTQIGMGSTSQGLTTRFQLTGKAKYMLTDPATGSVLLEGQVASFTGYSATGTTVATLAAERDARRRLMVILADQVVDKLLMAASGLPE
jgi:LPS-assembly lipoprotein